MALNPMVHCQLWMGSLEPNMTESFIMAAFQKMGEHPQNVKVIRNKYTGEPAGYCFVHFATDEEAIDAMHKLNGKPIPGTNPVIRFRLNSASRDSKLNSQTERDYSLWVGDLSSDVDDYSLYRAFSSKYSSIKAAKVILDGSGFSKGYGFVRFGNEEEQKNALWAMNGYVGLGTKVLKICNAVPKPKATTVTVSSTTTTPQTYTSADYSQQYYDPSTYWQNYSQAWSGYYGTDQMNTTADSTQMMTASYDTTVMQTPEVIEDDFALIEHKIQLDVEAANEEILDQDRNMWEALENSRWLPSDILPVFVN